MWGRGKENNNFDNEESSNVMKLTFIIIEQKIYILYLNLPTLVIGINLSNRHGDSLFIRIFISLQNCVLWLTLALSLSHSLGFARLCLACGSLFVLLFALFSLRCWITHKHTYTHTTLTATLAHSHSRIFVFLYVCCMYVVRYVVLRKFKKSKQATKEITWVNQARFKMKYFFVTFRLSPISTS